MSWTCQSGRENGEHLKLPRDSRVASIQQSTGMAPVLFFLPQPFHCRTCYQHQQLDQRHIFPCGLFPLITRNLQWVLITLKTNSPALLVSSSHTHHMCNSQSTKLMSIPGPLYLLFPAWNTSLPLQGIFAS